MFRVPSVYRIRTHPQLGTSDADGNNGAFEIANSDRSLVLFCIASDGEGWDHVSVRTIDKGVSRIPTWDEMNFVKELFWSEDECVVQYHPPADEYVNVHPHVLHLWRSRWVDMPRPPASMVG